MGRRDWGRHWRLQVEQTYSALDILEDAASNGANRRAGGDIVGVFVDFVVGSFFFSQQEKTKR